MIKRYTDLQILYFTFLTNQQCQSTEGKSKHWSQAKTPTGLVLSSPSGSIEKVHCCLYTRSPTPVPLQHFQMLRVNNSSFWLYCLTDCWQQSVLENSVGMSRWKDYDFIPIYF